MSDSSWLSLVVFDKHDAKVKHYLEHIGSKAVSDLLDFESDSERNLSQLKGELKQISANTRGGAFQFQCKLLLDAIGTANSLRFLSQELYTHRVFQNYQNKNEDDQFITPQDATQYLNCEKCYGVDFQYTVINPLQYQSIIKSLERLLIWSTQNISLTTQALYKCKPGEKYEKYRDVPNSVVEQQLLEDIENAVVCHDPNNEGPHDDDGSGFDFLFSVLKTIHEDMIHAKTFGLSAVYFNGEFASLCSWIESIKNPNHKQKWHEQAE